MNEPLPPAPEAPESRDPAPAPAPSLPEPLNLVIPEGSAVSINTRRSLEEAHEDGSVTVIGPVSPIHWESPPSDPEED
jgi:hypothetical protein